MPAVDPDDPVPDDPVPLSYLVTRCPLSSQTIQCLMTQCPLSCLVTRCPLSSQTIRYLMIRARCRAN
ncbi:unnamed protein product [Staurois parvus]|uniref:Uncharacterized protein n=1 Tax=Staurois parvus TaxID=386267 RepID=A0ABN9FLC2_9NEOB|nr:unnamed protein product [Staurois parvus]